MVHVIFYGIVIITFVELSVNLVLHSINVYLVHGYLCSCDWHVLITMTLNNKFVCLMVFNATFNNISVISWRSVLLVEETGGPRENPRPVASHWQTLSHNVVHLALFEIRTHISGDIHWLHIGSCKSNYHTMTAMIAPH